jgi:hypothetical protein
MDQYVSQLRRGNMINYVPDEHEDSSEKEVINKKKRRCSIFVCGNRSKM